MRRGRTWIIGLVLPVVAVAVAVGLRATESPAHALSNCDTSTGSMDGIETEVLALINHERQLAGLTVLLPSPGLSRAAAWKSEDRQTSYGTGLSHTDSLGRDPTIRANSCGYPSQAAENIAWGYPTAASVVAAWMDSAGHRANILHSRYVVAGIGHSDRAWTLDFGIVNDFGSSVPAVTSITQPSATPTPTASPTPTPTPTPGRAAVIALLSRD